jgi:hypothetical protein
MDSMMKYPVYSMKLGKSVGELHFWFISRIRKFPVGGMLPEKREQVYTAYKCVYRKAAHAFR